MTDVTWETSTLRTWLNNDFYNAAFSADEKGVIIEQSLKNEDNEAYGTAGGNDTTDKVYLPSLADMMNPAYGFSDNYGFFDQARIGKATSYAQAQGVYANGELDSWWWLRSPGGFTDYASDVYDIGNVVTHGDYVCTCVGVRPALHFNLSSSPLTKKGGVTADESGITYSEEQEQGMTEAPKPETPATEAPTTEAPKPETPATEIPTTEIPKPETPATEAPTTEAPKLDHPTKLNLTNKKTYKTSRKVTVKDADGIQTIRLNGKSVKVKKGKESCSFKLSVYRKYLKKKGKWNKLVVTDLNGKKKTVKFKTK